MKGPESTNVKNRRSWEKACEELKPAPAFYGQRFPSIEFLSLGGFPIFSPVLVSRRDVMRWNAFHVVGRH